MPAPEIMPGRGASQQPTEVELMETSRLRAEIQVPNHIVVPRNRKTVKIDLVALIHNDGDDHYVVGAANASQIRHSCPVPLATTRIPSRMSSKDGPGSVGIMPPTM